MDYIQKVMWSEGMFLTPHHFQQWDRYHESLLHKRLGTIQPTGWGVCEIGINPEALTNGEVILSRCVAVLPDGLAIDVPGTDGAPPGRPLGAAFDAGRTRLGVYVGAALPRPGAATVQKDEGMGLPARFRSRTVTVADEVTGGAERQIDSVVKDLRILLEGESLDDYSCLKIGEIERTSAGGFTLREAYVPPCLYLSASSYLVDLLRRLLDVLAAKRTELAGQRRGGQQGLVQFTMAEAANFWFLHTVNATLPILMHYHGRPQVHPERVYLELARLVGELCTFAPEGDPTKVPPYQHEDLITTFSEVERSIQNLLETVIPTRCSPVALEKTRESLWTGRIPDESLLDAAEFYLAVSTGVPDEKVIREIPIKAKISSPDRVDQLIAQALRGVSLMHRPTPPSEIPVQPGRTYFQMGTTGEHWEAVKGAQSLSIYVPPEFVDLRLELMAVKEE